jgi:phage terminase large subunit-like protein
VVEFCRRYLTHAEGEWAGAPVVFARWQIERIIRPLFNVTLASGLRQYRMVYVEIPKKNGKSLTAAALALYLLVADQEEGAQVAVAATDRKQAGLIFRTAKRMVEHDATLSELVVPYRDSLEVPSTHSRFIVLSSEAPRAHGLNLSALIYDELHAAPNRELWDALTGSMAARRQPLALVLTTADYDRHSVCWQLHEHALQVRDGLVVDDSFLPVVYHAQPEDDWTDPRVWARVNPNLGVTVKREFLEQECRRARAMPAAENTFKRLHLNVWTATETKWLNLEAWAACGDQPDMVSLIGRRCFIGVDLSSTKDLSAVVTLFPNDDGSYAVLCDCWLPEDHLEARVRRDRVPFDLWARQGLVHLTSGNVIDYAVIEQRLRELVATYQVEAISIDPWNATQMIARLQADSIPAAPQPQTYAGLTSATKALETLVLTSKLHHGHHPVLTWCAANVVVDTDAHENLKPNKAKSTERIDLISALVNALAVALPAVAGSVYDARAPLLVEL